MNIRFTRNSDEEQERRVTLRTLSATEQMQTSGGGECVDAAKEKPFGGLRRFRAFAHCFWDKVVTA